MSVGGQASNATVDQKLTDLSVSLRNVMHQIRNLSTWINGQGNGLTMLEGLGYNATDAQTALNQISFLNTVAGVYYGTASQTPAFNFDNELSQLWAGQ